MTPAKSWLRLQTWDARFAAKVIGYALLSGTLACTAGVAGQLLFTLRIYLNLKHPRLAEEETAIGFFSHKFYAGDFRHLWQSERACVAYDPELLYVPREGECRFDNVEFRTTMHFDLTGRRHRFPGAGSPILVLGDSHAMGWGVGDDDTLAARLAEFTGRPVYNLGVSSYGTAREILWAIRHPVFRDARVLIIQYCENDDEENVAFLAGTNPPPDQERFESLFTYQPLELSVPNVFRLTLLELRKQGVRSFLRLALSRHPRETLILGSEAKAHILAVLRLHAAELAGKQVYIFDSNSGGKNYADWPTDTPAPDVTFVHVPLGRELYYVLDDHLRPAGHEQLARHFAALIAPGTSPSTPAAASARRSGASAP